MEEQNISIAEAVHMMDYDELVEFFQRTFPERFRTLWIADVWLRSPYKGEPPMASWEDNGGGNLFFPVHPNSSIKVEG